MLIIINILIFFLLDIVDHRLNIIFDTNLFCFKWVFVLLWVLFIYSLAKTGELDLKRRVKP